MKNISKLILVLLLVVTPVVVSAQSAKTPNDRVFTTPTATGPFATQLVSSLSNLPEADALIYVNPHRILSDFLPRVMSPKDLAEMQKGFEEVKKNAGFDPTKIDYLVIAVRFRKPTADLNFQTPEYMMVSSGDFSAESLIGLARMATQGQLRDETYGNKKLGVMTIDPLAKEAQKNPLLKGFTDVGVVALEGNTIAAGTPNYLRAAIDAGSGKGRIDPTVLNSFIRDPNVLVSFAASPWTSFAKSFGMLGTETTPRAPRCDSRIGDMYLALTMDAQNFSIRGISNADNPDTAKILANLYTNLLQYATKSVPDPGAQMFLKGLAINAEGDDILLRADFPQQMVIDLIQNHMKPKPREDVDVVTPPAPKPPVKKRRTRRRH